MERSIKNRVLGNRPPTAKEGDLNETNPSISGVPSERATLRRRPPTSGAATDDYYQPQPVGGNDDWRTVAAAGVPPSHKYYTSSLATGEGNTFDSIDGSDNNSYSYVDGINEEGPFRPSGGDFQRPLQGIHTNPPTPQNRGTAPSTAAVGRTHIHEKNHDGIGRSGYTLRPSREEVDSDLMPPSRTSSPLPRVPTSRTASMLESSMGTASLVGGGDQGTSLHLLREEASPRLPTLSDRINSRSPHEHHQRPFSSFQQPQHVFETHEALVMLWMYTGLMKNRTVDESFVPSDSGSWRPRKLTVTLRNRENERGEIIKDGIIKLQKFDDKQSIRLDDEIHRLKSVTRFVIPKNHPVPFPTNPEGDDIVDFENFYDEDDGDRNNSLSRQSSMYHSFSRSFGHGQLPDRGRVVGREESVDGFDPRSPSYTDQVPYFLRESGQEASFISSQGSSPPSPPPIPVYSKKHDVVQNRRFTCGNIGLRIVSSAGKVYIMAMQNCPDVDSWLETLREVIQVHERDATFDEPPPDLLVATQTLLSRPDCNQYKRDFLAIDLSKKERNGNKGGGSTKVSIDRPPHHGNVKMISEGVKKQAEWRLWAQTAGEAGLISCYKMNTSMIGKPIEKLMSLVGGTPSFNTIDANSCEIYVEVPWASTVIELTSTSMQGVLYLECEKIELRIQWEQWLQLMGATKVLSLEERSAMEQDDALSLGASFFFRGGSDDEDSDAGGGSVHSTKLRADSFMAVKYGYRGGGGRGGTGTASRKRSKSSLGGSTSYNDDEEDLLLASCPSPGESASQLPAHPDAPYRRGGPPPALTSSPKSPALASPPKSSLQSNVEMDKVLQNPLQPTSPPTKGYVADVVRQQEIVDATKLALQIEEEALREKLLDEENTRLYEFEDAMDGVLKLVRELRHKEKLEEEKRRQEKDLERVRAHDATHKDIEELRQKQEQQFVAKKYPSGDIDALISSADDIGSWAGTTGLDYSKRSMKPRSAYDPSTLSRTREAVITTPTIFDHDRSGRLIHLTSSAGLTTLRCPRRVGEFDNNEESISHGARSSTLSLDPSAAPSMVASLNRYDPNHVYDGNDPELTLGGTTTRSRGGDALGCLPNDESFITNALQFSYQYPNSPIRHTFKRDDSPPTKNLSPRLSPKVDSATRYLTTIHQKRSEMQRRNQVDVQQAAMLCAICGENKRDVVKCSVTNRKHVTQPLTERERLVASTKRQLIL